MSHERSAPPQDRALVVAVATALLTLGLSLVPVPVEGRRFGPYGPDKWPHVGSHAVVAAAVAAGVDPAHRPGRAAAIGAAVSTGFGVVVETAQAVVPWRTGEGVDVTAGAVGAVLGAVGWLLAVGARGRSALE